ncbi:cell wall-binding repeat-containing protein [Euzebya rosea]|uniref:cell wall-binding repeat-containing protein n=1 Tax=Euzebya rosea TaxID=2052804 RepID=UPI001475A1F4|nr:cell wall-binding repeat-containing protein [Euzebya rosea]
MAARVMPGASRPLALVLLLAMVFAGLLATPAGAALPSGDRIGASDAPTAASIDIAQRTVADGAATRVALGRNDVFPDNLAGSAAAGADGVLLLVDPAPAGLDDAVAAELTRLLGSPAEDECTDANVVLLGGEAALGAELAADLTDAGWCIDRLSGPSRVETAVDIALDVVGDGPRETLLIARDDNPADSATAGAWAAATGTPIVVTPTDSLHEAVGTLLAPGEDPWDDVILLGGTAALSADVETLVMEAAGTDTEVRRIAGVTRDDTALRIAEDLWGELAGDAVAIVNGFTDTFWTYALPGGVAAASENAPLLYVTADSVPTTTAGYLGREMPAVTTIGPATAVPDAVKAEAEALAGGDGPGGIGEDLRIVELPLPEDGGGTATVPIAEGDISVLFMVQGGTSDGTMVIDGVTGPDGFALTAEDIPENSNRPDVALSLPQFPGQFEGDTLPAGDYAFTYSSEAPISRVVALVKSGDPAARQEIDVNYVDVSTVGHVDTPEEQAAVVDVFDTVGEEIMGGFGLHPGATSFTTAPEQVRTDYSVVDSSTTDIADLCRAIVDADTDRRALNFAFVDRITEGGEDVGIDGLSSGLPGSVVLGGFGVSCVIIATDVPDTEDGQPGILGAGPVAWHEAGHLMGLAHTTQADGIEHDLLADTPECDIANDADDNGEVDDVECGELGDNFMFWTGLSSTMTADQAFMLARNPLFQPRAG